MINFSNMHENNEGKESLLIASFSIRFGAFLVDILIYSLFIAWFIFMVTLFTPESSFLEIGRILDYILWVVYSTLFLALFSTTPGKKVYGLKVLDQNQGKLDFGRSLLRSILQPLSTFLFGIGYWTMRKYDNLAWHDRKADTIVVINKKVNLILPIILTILGMSLFLLNLFIFVAE